MLRDKRDDFDENEDADLTGMIHQYNEDNELRRKINEMKKQKAESKPQEAVDFDDDNVFIPSSLKKDEDEPILNIRADEDVEKTRVGFVDERDKTLVIMDRKNKVEPSYADFEEETPVMEEDFHQSKELEEEDLRETIRRKKNSKNDEDGEEESDKEKKINKTIMYVIIGILSVALLVGIGFGVKALFFSGSDEKVSDVDDKEKETTTKKDKDKKKKDDSEIKDNSAIIKQLQEQQNTYEDQLEQVKRDISKAQNDESAAQASLDNITKLYNDMSSLERQMGAIGSSLEDVENKMKTACNLDSSSQECLDTTTNFNQYSNLNSQYNLKKQQYDIENAKTNTYLNNKKAAGDKITNLKQQQTDLEKKIAEIETKLASYDK